MVDFKSIYKQINTYNEKFSLNSKRVFIVHFQVTLSVFWCDVWYMRRVNPDEDLRLRKRSGSYQERISEPKNLVNRWRSLSHTEMLNPSGQTTLPRKVYQQKHQKLQQTPKIELFYFQTKIPYSFVYLNIIQCKIFIMLISYFIDIIILRLYRPTLTVYNFVVTKQKIIKCRFTPNPIRFKSEFVEFCSY